MERFDAIIGGAGIAGVSTALHLQRRGMKVALMDRREPGQETSFGNAGIIEASFVLPYAFPPLKRFADILLDRNPAARVDLLFLPRILTWLWKFYQLSSVHNREINGCLMRPLVEDAVTEHQELMRASGAERYLCKEGRVKLYRSAQSFAGDAFEREALQKHGVPFDIYDTSQFLEIEPHIKPIFYRAMKLGSSARVTDPGAVVQSYARCFVDNGGTFIKGDAATLTQAPDGMWCGAGIKAPNVVVALGPWAPAMLRPLGYDFLIGQKRGYHQHFKINVPIRHAIVDADIGYVMSPTMRGARIATGAEFAALDAPPNPVQIARVLPFARELFALEEAVEDISWMGSRPCTIDSLPIVGRAPNHKGLWLNIGHGHSGFTIGPATGKLLAQMMVGEKPFIDPQPYRALRF